MTLMSKESWDAMVEEQKREINNIKQAQKNEREKVIDEVLEILKHNVLFPPSQSVNIFKKVQALKDSSKSPEVKNG